MYRKVLNLGLSLFIVPSLSVCLSPSFYLSPSPSLFLSNYAHSFSISPSLYLFLTLSLSLSFSSDNYPSISPQPVLPISLFPLFPAISILPFSPFPPFPPNPHPCCSFQAYHQHEGCGLIVRQSQRTITSQFHSLSQNNSCFFV